MAAAAKSLRAALAAGALLGLAGCAVLQIDVDVYKGPLANHEDVQMEQFAAMAIGAKPLLIALRDRLQWPEDKDRDCARNETWYEARFFPEQKFVEWVSKSDPEKREPGCWQGKSVSWREPAGRVNAVLSLYEDLGDRKLGKFVTDGKVAFKQYRAALQKLEPKRKPNKKTDADTWISIEEGFKEPSPTVNNKSLIGALKGLVHPAESNWREVKGIYKKYKNSPDNTTEEGKFGTYDSNEELGRVGEFDLLRTPKILDRIVSRLFKEEGAKLQARAFKAEVVALADAYFEGRQAVRDMMITGLHALKYLNSVDYRGGDREHLSRVAVSALLELMQPQHIALAIDKTVATEDFPGLLELRDLLTASEKNPFWDNALACNQTKGNCWSKERFEKAKRIIGHALFLHPTKSVDLLLRADLILMRKFAGEKTGRELNFKSVFGDRLIKDCENASRTLPNCQSIKELEQFGIARGPSLDPKQIDSDTIASAGETLAAGAAVGFDKGRLPEGIESLIETYLTKAAAVLPAKNSKAAVEERKTAKVQLRYALVRFSEKVLFIANNDKLLSKNREGIDRYVLVLQSVGNSIMIQANELRFREEHARKLKGRLTAEIRAVERVLGRPPETLIDDVLAGIQADLERAGERQTVEEAAVLRTGNELIAATTRKTDAGTERDDAVKQRDTAKSALDTARNDAKPIWAASKVMKSKLGDQLRAAAETAGAATMDKMVAKIAEKIAEIVAQKRANAFSKFVDQIDTSDLDLAKTYFTEEREATAADLTAIATMIQDDENRAKKKISGLETAFVETQAILREKKAKLRDAKNSLNRATKAATEATARLKATKELIPKLENTVEMLEAHRVNAIEDIRKSNVDLKPSEVYARLIDWLEDMRAEPDNEQAAKLADTIEILKGRGPPSDPLLLDGVWLAEKGEGWDPKHPNARDVLDTLIAALRHEHTEAVKETGPKGGRAPRLAAALKVAYEQRAGMAYIRPSAAYLRSSYPSTSLQNDPGLAWRNMLAGHALRSVPIVGGGLVNPSSDAEKRKIVKEIDKQFWQTINQVRVAGAGETNYVIAKDDIGNWYVKAFSADPKVIIKSAQKLALFNVGAQLDTNLLSRLDAKDGETPEDVSKPSLQRLFEEFEKDYAEKTGKHFAALKASIEGAELETSIEEAWSGIENVETYFKRSDIESDLTANFDTLQKTKFEETEAAKQSSKILSAASAVLRFHGNLARDIRGRTFAVEPAAVLRVSETQLAAANGELKTEETKLTQKKAERDTANDIVQEKLRATELDREGFDEAQKNLEKKEAEVTAQETAVNEKKTTVRDAEAAVATARGNLKKVQDAERLALAALKRAVREELIKLTASRNQTVKTFQTGVLFIGKATKPAAKPKPKPTPAVAETDVRDTQ